ncbi:MAG: HupE/UreJ family protein [Limnobacter sp.]|nr:HupE/UreJ family protein [Limnobacter sp.]
MITTLRTLLMGLILLAGLMQTTPSHAHKPSDSYLSFDLQQGSNEFALRWDIALRDLDFALDLDTDQSGDLTWGEVQAAEARATEFALSLLTVKANNEEGAACTLSPQKPAQLDQHSDGTYLVLWLNGQCEGTPRKGLMTEYRLFFDLDPTHRGLAQWTVEGKPSGSVLLRPEAKTALLSFEEQSLYDTTLDYIKEGVWHIWIGIDHILFLLALLLPAVLVRYRDHWRGVEALPVAVKDIVKVVTAFTVAHSITLSLAALEVVQLPSKWVESTIALSVVLVALNNLRGSVHARRWVIAFAFGLLHGFGFASVLADLGLPTQLLTVALLSFNVGVELGQLAIVLLVMPVAYALRNTRFYRIGILQGGSIVVAIIAAIWTYERITGTVVLGL